MLLQNPDVWQMDVGPLLLPLPGPEAAAALESDRPVAGLGVGYLVFNSLRPSYVEAVCRPPPGGGGASVDATGPLGETAWFSEAFTLAPTDVELFGVFDSAEHSAL